VTAVAHSSTADVETVAGAVRLGTARLAGAGVAESRLEAELLLADQLGWRRLDLYRDPGYRLAPPQRERFAAAVERRAAGEPLQYVRGWEEFCGLMIEVGPGVLVPRPETELLVEQAVAHLRGVAQPSRFVDLGTGSGCVAIAMASAVETATGVAIDYSDAALTVARRNRARHGLAERIALLQGDLCEPLAARHDGQCDLIVANLPYVPTAEIASLAPHVRDWEPRLALDGGPDGLAVIERLLASAGPFLSADGRLMLEIGAGQSERVAGRARRHGWRVQSVVPDLAGIDRVIILRMSDGGFRGS
jgi:release factor glutamine methyltransferase